jgi:hypothetical protein
MTPAISLPVTIRCLFRSARSEYQGTKTRQGANEGGMTALGYVISDGRGAVDRLLTDVAGILQDRGANLAGVVQINTEVQTMHRCDMDLQVLGADQVVRISQRLGNDALGCRLDPQGLEEAAGLVEAGLGPQALLIVNKFGKTEIDGRGFRPVIARALDGGMPVLVGLNRGNLEGFQGFAEGFGQEIAADPAAILAWCATQGVAGP